MGNSYSRITKKKKICVTLTDFKSLLSHTLIYFKWYYHYYRRPERVLHLNKKIKKKNSKLCTYISFFIWKKMLISLKINQFFKKNF